MHASWSLSCQCRIRWETMWYAAGANDLEPGRCTCTVVIDPWATAIGKRLRSHGGNRGDRLSGWSLSVSTGAAVMSSGCP